MRLEAPGEVWNIAGARWDSISVAKARVTSQQSRDDLIPVMNHSAAAPPAIQGKREHSLCSNTYGQLWHPQKL